MNDIILGNIITINRGDTIKCPIFLNCGTKLTPVRYTLIGTDRLYFALMEPNQPFENAIVKKTYNADSPKTIDGDTIFHLRPRDTQNLLSGTYYYTIKIITDITPIYLDTLGLKTTAELGDINLGELLEEDFDDEVLNSSIVTTLVPSRKFCILP